MLNAIQAKSCRDRTLHEGCLQKQIRTSPYAYPADKQAADCQKSICTPTFAKRAGKINVGVPHNEGLVRVYVLLYV